MFEAHNGVGLGAHSSFLIDWEVNVPLGCILLT